MTGTEEAREGRRDSVSGTVAGVPGRASVRPAPPMRDKPTVPPHTMLWETLHGDEPSCKVMSFLSPSRLGFSPCSSPVGGCYSVDFPSVDER